MNSEIKQCQNCKKSFTIEPEDFAFYEKMKVPAPTWCPECRLQRRLSFLNFIYLYNGSVRCVKEISSPHIIQIPLRWFTVQNAGGLTTGTRENSGKTMIFLGRFLNSSGNCTKELRSSELQLISTLQSIVPIIIMREV